MKLKIVSETNKKFKPLIIKNFKCGIYPKGLHITWIQYDYKKRELVLHVDRFTPRAIEDVDGDVTIY